MATLRIAIIGNAGNHPVLPLPATEARESTRVGAYCKASQIQKMRVLPGELSIHPGSYRCGCSGDREAEAGEKGGCVR